jgi:phosphoglycerate kinase
MKKSIRDIDVSGKRVLVRVDFNVPLDPKTNAIMDDSRIRATIPTLDYLIEHKARIILCSHLGRPDGKMVESMRMAPVAKRLSDLIKRPVATTSDCIGPEVEKAAASLKDGDILMLENLRFHNEEEANDPQFSRQLANLAQIYVDDAFGTAHRAHASTAGVAAYLPAVAGFLMQKELDALGQAVGNPARPFCSLLGGAKIADKLALVKNFVAKVDCLLIGGGMAAGFLKAKGYNVGLSGKDENLDVIRDIMDQSAKKGITFLLPEDVVITQKADKDASAKVVTIDSIPDDYMIADIGPKTAQRFCAELKKAKTVLWNGPMGIYEYSQFAGGTKTVAYCIADLKATTIIGGGSTADVVEELGLSSKMTHVSTGGGASLMFLEGKTLPGVAVLQDK